MGWLEAAGAFWGDAMHLVLAEVQQRLRLMEQEPFYATIGDLLDNAARATPDRVAIDFFERGERLTCLELLRSVNRAANAFRSVGIAHGTRVAVMMPNRIEYPVTWLALAKLGAIMVPLNNGYTTREITYALNDADAAFAVVDESCIPIFVANAERPHALADDHIICVGLPPVAGVLRWSDLMGNASDGFSPAWTVSGSDSVGIQYTSGTTGLPKGCLLPQSYWLHLARAAKARSLPVERMLVQNLFFYMNCQLLLLNSLSSGATLFVADKPSATRFIPWIKELGIHWCIFPEVVLKQPVAPDDPKTQLRCVALAAFSKDGHKELERRFQVPGREIFGMTEIGPGTFMPFEVTDMVGSGSIGGPSLFRKARVVDAEGQSVAAGVPGELQIAGPHMLKEYVNKPEATKASFVGEWFRTGDLATYDDQGFFYVVGRLKDMIRRGGENISAFEVESVIRQLPQIVDCAVTAVPDDTRGEEVRVTIELPARPESGLIQYRKDLVDEVIAHCSQNLARFKIPRYFGFIENLPRTASNKLAKHQIVPSGTDQRKGTFDRVDGIWR